MKEEIIVGKFERIYCYMKNKGLEDCVWGVKGE